MRLSQVYQNDKTLLEATRERIEFIFDNFDDIKVSVSGGKDSTVIAHLMLMEAKRRNRKIGVFFLDEEVMYQSSIDMVTHIIEEMSPDNVIPLWLQIEFNLTNATSLSEPQLIAWESGKHDIWMRPKKSYAIKFPMWDQDTQIVANKTKGFGFYDVITNFERCYHNAAFVVGLRATESINRYRAVCKNPVNVNGTMVYWGTKNGEDSASLYPIYDWNFHDVWRYIADNKLRYSKVYDWQFRKGMPINEMRVSSLIHERSFKSIVELPEFEPKTYNRLVKRLQGIEFAQETGKNAKSFRCRKLPKNFNSWIAYRDFLLATYPDEALRQVFIKRFSKHLENEYVARQQCRQLLLNDYENNLPVENKPDPREALIQYYMENL